jgi:hypothetical protein
MAKARRGPKRNVGKAALVLGAAGVSLAVTGGASATAPTTSVPSLDNARRVFLGEEEISDISLATVRVFETRSDRACGTAWLMGGSTDGRPKLIVFGISHFCEKARWALDWHGITYSEISWGPGLHRVLLKRYGARALLCRSFWTARPSFKEAALSSTGQKAKLRTGPEA